MLAYLFYRFGYLLSVKLPLEAGYSVATFLSVLKYYFSPRDREAVVHNLKLILPPSEHSHIRRYARAVFINFGKYLLEFFRFEHLKKENLRYMLHVKGLHFVDDALRKKKGVIILSAHMGNWELGGVFMALLGYPMIAVALPHRHKKVNEFFNRQREMAGAIVVPSIGAAMRRIYAALKHNKIVALVGDRDFGGGGRRMSFLGSFKHIPRGPAVLAKRTGAELVPGFVTRQKDGTYLLEFLPAVSGDLNEEAMITEYTKIIEAEIRKNPSQWLMFREFDKE